MIALQHRTVFADGISRREKLAGLAATLFLPGIAPMPRLVAIGRRAGCLFGGAARASVLNDPLIPGLLARECATLTPELEWKWAAIAPVAGRRDWAGADRIAAFARAHGLRVRGHTLLWHRSIPAWAADELAHRPDWRLVKDHIQAVVGRYSRLVGEWDVVNEPIEVGGGDDGLRDSPFLRAFGGEYVARALHEAHAAAPRARLFVNEYDLEYPQHQRRRDALLALARALVGRGVPLHGIGIQAHLDLAKGPIDLVGLRAFLKAIAALGLKVSITELDVKERDYILPAGERDRLVADHVATFLAAVLPNVAVGSLTCWGISDRQSWLSFTDADRARFPGAWADGSSPGLNRGLPYDSDGVAKPMRAAIATALSRKPA